VRAARSIAINGHRSGVCRPRPLHATAAGNEMGRTQCVDDIGDSPAHSSAAASVNMDTCCEAPVIIGVPGDITYPHTYCRPTNDLILHS